MELQKLRLEQNFQLIPQTLKKMRIQDEFALLEVQIEALLQDRRQSQGFENIQELSDVVTIDYFKLYSNPQYSTITQISSILLNSVKKPQPGLSLISALGIENFVLGTKWLFFCGKYTESFALVEDLGISKSDLDSFNWKSAYEIHQLLQILAVICGTFRKKRMPLPVDLQEFIVKLLIENCLQLKNFIVNYNCWWQFVSEILYSCVLFHLWKGNTDKTVLFCRSYLQYMAFAPNDFEPARRIVVLRALLRQFLLHIRHFNFKPMTVLFHSSSSSSGNAASSSAGESTLESTKESLMIPKTLTDELAMVLSMYEYLVFTHAPFPPAGTRGVLAETVYDEITLCYSIFSPHQHASNAYLWVEKEEEKTQQEMKKTAASSPAQKESKEDSDWGSSDQKAVWKEVKSSWELFIDCMYRATKKTFRSRTVLRRLGLAAMMCESIDEAYLSFKTYLEKDRKDTSQNDWWKNAPLHPSGDLNGRWTETVLDVLAVLVSVCRLSLDTHQTQLALVYIEKAVSVCKDHSQIAGRLMYSVVYYMLGSSYSRLGLETLEHEHYCNLQDQAHLMLREAERFDPDDWRVHYSIAAQASEMGNQRIALDHIKLSLKLKPNHIPSWHVLILLTLSANNELSEYEAVKKAIALCKTAGQTLTSGRRPAPTFNPRMPRNLSRDQLDQWLNLQLTHILIEECLAHQSLSYNNEKRTGEFEKFSADPKYFDILEGYECLFDIYELSYFQDLPEDVEVEKPPLFTSGEKTMADHISPLPHIVDKLNDGNHPALPSLYPTTMHASDAYGFSFSSGFFPSTADPVEPIRFAWFCKNRKHRYMEIWNQLSQVFRRAKKFHDARVACSEAQKVERGNADVEFELGMIALFSDPRPQEQTTIQPSSFGLVRNMDDHLPAILNKEIALTDEHSMALIRTAIQHFQCALTYDDEHLLARTWLGRCFSMQKRYEMARAELERAVKGGRVRGPKVWHACHQLGIVYIQLESYDKASEYFASALKNASFCVSLMMMRGFEVVPRYI